jgi:hypothetical protein
MKLADLRRLTIKKRLKVHFRLKNGMEGIVTEQGIATVPALKAVPDFNLEDELSSAAEFLVEAAPPAQSRTVQRAEMMSLVSASPMPAAAHDHDDE